jgi:hypothetical protein
VKVQFVLQDSAGSAQATATPSEESYVNAAHTFHDFDNVTHVTLRTAGRGELGTWDIFLSKIMIDSGADFLYGFFLCNEAKVKKFTAKDIVTDIFISDHKRRRLVTSVPDGCAKLFDKYSQYGLDYRFDSGNAYIVVLQEGLPSSDSPTHVAQTLTAMFNMKKEFTVFNEEDTAEPLQEKLEKILRKASMGSHDKKRCVFITNNALFKYIPLYQVAMGLYQLPPIMLQMKPKPTPKPTP